MLGISTEPLGLGIAVHSAFLFASSMTFDLDISLRNYEEAPLRVYRVQLRG